MKKKIKQVQHIPQEKDNVKKPKSRIINNRVTFMCQYCNHTGKSSGVIFSHVSKAWHKKIEMS